MSAVPQPTASETRCNATYEALMWALTRPGLPRDLPTERPGERPDERPDTGSVCILEALIDRECRVYCDSADMTRQAQRTGAEIVPVSQADHVFLDSLNTPDLLRDIAMGSDLHPEDGATLVVKTQIGEGAGLRLTGPGVDGQIDVTLAGLPDGFWTLRRNIMRYPMGFEIFLTDGARVLGIPRTTAVEVL